MKRNILTLACLSLAMLSLADEPQYAIEELLGAKIASVDAYNFVWNDSTGTPEIIESDCAMMGKYCKLTSSSSSGSIVFLSNFYGDFKIPLNINPTTGVVSLKTLAVIDVMSSLSNSSDPIRLNGSNPDSTATEITYWTLYAVPLSWLMGDDDCGEYINGQVKGDSITFNDFFAFLVKIEEGDSVSWGLSPIFKYLTLLTPNGTHGFYYTRLVAHADPGPDDQGYGGLVPRPNKPGSSKPVSPRPISSIIGAKNPNSNSNRLSHIKLDTLLLHIKELWSVVGPVCLPDGYGGLVPGRPGRPGKPGTSRPKSTEPFNDLVNSGGPETDINTVSKSNVGDANGPKTTHEVAPVYMAFADDTTLMVYNLFGMGLRCHLRIDKNNGTINIPRQQIKNDGLGHVLYNTSCSGTWSQDGVITWDKTTSGFGFLPYFESNVLQFSGDSPFTVPIEPRFADPVVTDEKVELHATTNEFYGMEVIFYMYNEETDYYEVADNPLTVPRLDIPYAISLAAIAYNPNTGVCSETVWFEYEVPALGESILRGDVNNDGAVSISDVTAMIDGLLSGNWDGKNYHNADCNLDEEVNISDVTTLIDYLLSGSWAK